MNITCRTLPKSQVEIDIELSTEEMRPYLEKAAVTLSREHKVKGFRPGKLPLAMAIQQFGAMAVWQEAADQGIRDGYVRAIRDQHVQTVGSPQIAVQKLAPENPVQFTATVAVLPAVTLPDFSTITVQRRPVHITDADVEKALGELQRMQPNETLVERPSVSDDKVVVDMHLTIDRVPVEGGQAKDHGIHLNEEYALPKVREELLGVRAGTEKTFPLEIPKDHPMTHIAGRTVDCTVTVKGIYAIAYPELNDDFAKRLGIEQIATLRARIRENIELEATQRAEHAEEVDLLEAIMNHATIGDLPEVLITSEAHRMLDELEQQVARQGMEFSQYLEAMKKTRDDIFLGFAPEAVKRVKIALITRAIAEQHTQETEIHEADVEAEIAEQLARYQHEEGFAERIQSEEARMYVHRMLRNRKATAWLRSQVQWKEPKLEQEKAT